MDVNCEVLVTLLQMDDQLYRKGDIIILPEDRALRLGNSVRIIPEPEPEPEPIMEPATEEGTESEDAGTGETTPKKDKKRGGKR